jgi:hypothetical protein
VLVGLFIVALFERLAAEQELRDAMRRLDFDQVAGELDGATPIGSGGFKQKACSRISSLVGSSASALE